MQNLHVKNQHHSATLLCMWHVIVFAHDPLVSNTWLLYFIGIDCARLGPPWTTSSFRQIILWNIIESYRIILNQETKLPGEVKLPFQIWM